MMAPEARFEELYELDRQWFWHPGAQMAEYGKVEPTIIVGGSGYRLRDHRGKEYIDGNSGVWCAHLGYGQQQLIDAATVQLKQLPYASLFSFTHEPAIQLCAKLAHLMPGKPGRVFLTTGGAEAAETALKMSRQYFRQNGAAERYMVISLRGGYHGLTFGAMSAGGMPRDRRKFEPLLDGFYQVDPPFCFRCPWGRKYGSCGFPCVEALEREINYRGPENIAAIIVEPIIASGGLIVPPPEYLPSVAALSRKIGALLIVDEVTTGFGRTGKMFAFEHSGIEPDIITLSKGITSGYVPLGAVIATDRVYEGFLGTEDSGRAFPHAFTFGGHPVSCAVAITTLDVISENHLVDRARDIGAYLEKKLLELKARHSSIGDVRGRGLMYGIEFVDSDRRPLAVAQARAISRAALNHGLIIRSLGGMSHVLVLFPPLIIDKAGIDAIVDRLASAMHDVLHPATSIA